MSEFMSRLGHCVDVDWVITRTTNQPLTIYIQTDRHTDRQTGCNIINTIIVIFLKPDTHCRRRCDATVEVESRRWLNTHVGRRELVVNSLQTARRVKTPTRLKSTVASRRLRRCILGCSWSSIIVIRRHKYRDRQPDRSFRFFSAVNWSCSLTWLADYRDDIHAAAVTKLYLWEPDINSSQCSKKAAGRNLWLSCEQQGHI